MGMNTHMASPSRVVVVRSPQSSTSCCISCCSCCLPCLNYSVFNTQHGKLKIAQTVLAAVCQALMLRFGLQSAGLLGASFLSFLNTVSACLLTTSVLLACYLLSSKSVQLLRTSLFETLFNGVAAFFLLSASSYLGYAVITDLWGLYVSTPFFQPYPAMTTAYIIGLILGILYAVDAYAAYKQLRGIY